jgi:hypothetical protein
MPLSPPLTNLLAWYRSDATYKDAALTQRATITGDAIKGARDKAAGTYNASNSSNTFLTLQTSVVSGQPVVKCPTGTPPITEYLTPATALVIPAGPFTIYVVGQNTGFGLGVVPWLPLNGNYGAQYVEVSGTGVAGLTVDSGGVANQTTTTGAGSMIARWRRDSLNRPFFGATGFNEIQLPQLGSVAGTMTLNRIFGPGHGNFADVLVYAEDTVAAHDDTAVLLYLLDRYTLLFPGGPTSVPGDGPDPSKVYGLPVAPFAWSGEDEKSWQEITGDKERAEPERHAAGFAEFRDQLVRYQATARSIETARVPLVSVPDVPQHDHYSCGAAASMAVGSSFGVGPKNLPGWKRLLGTSERESTHWQAIVEAMRRLGLYVEARDGLTLADLAGYQAKRMPVIVPLQDYGPEVPPKAAWNYGHYVTVLGLVDDFVAIQDSSADNVLRGSGSIAAPGKVLVRDADFLRAWHDKTVDGVKLDRFGIAVGRAG